MDTTDHETHSSSYHSTSSERNDQVGGRLGRLLYNTRSNTISCFIFVRKKVHSFHNIVYLSTTTGCFQLTRMKWREGKSEEPISCLPKASSSFFLRSLSCHSLFGGKLPHLSARLCCKMSIWYVSHSNVIVMLTKGVTSNQTLNWHMIHDKSWH